MFSSYLIPLSSVDEEDTLAVETVVGIAMAASVGLIIVFIVVVVAVAVIAQWWMGNGTYDLKADVSMDVASHHTVCLYIAHDAV